MKITVDFRQLTQLQTDMQRWPEATRQAGAWVVQKAAQVAALDIKIAAPKAFSQLANSISIDQESPLLAWVGPHVRYAWWVLKGRKAGGKRPPLSAIQDWVLVKFKLPAGRESRAVAWKVARAIQRRGTQPNDFMTLRMVEIGPQMQSWALERLALVFRGNV